MAGQLLLGSPSIATIEPVTGGHSTPAPSKGPSGPIDGGIAAADRRGPIAGGTAAGRSTGPIDRRNRGRGSMAADRRGPIDRGNRGRRSTGGTAGADRPQEPRPRIAGCRPTGTDRPGEPPGPIDRGNRGRRSTGTDRRGDPGGLTAAAGWSVLQPAALWHRWYNQSRKDLGDG